MTFHLPWACVIIGCIFVSLGRASNTPDVYPPLWKESPGQFSDYKVEDGKYIINIWHYLERLGTYKILLNKTAKYFEKFAPENEQNILWGLPVHHGWQYRTGRLADPTQRTNCGHESRDYLCISVDSWWADVNYYLSAMPFLAAVDSGIMGISSDNITFLPPSKDQTNFCYNVSSCYSSFPETMKKWNKFYQSYSSSFEDLLKYLWAAHMSSLKVAHKKFGNRLKFYSKQEADFERSWALFVDYLAPPLFPTTLIRTAEFQKGLPTRMLVDGDKAPLVSDFTSFQNTVLLGLNFLHKVHKYTGKRQRNFYVFVNSALENKKLYNGKFGNYYVIQFSRYSLPFLIEGGNFIYNFYSLKQN
uniref:Protein LEG1 homolog n=1 Tax=Sus scrofa TaxID=9823 RepID=A0A8D1IPE0_PIG